MPARARRSTGSADDPHMKPKAAWAEALARLDPPGHPANFYQADGRSIEKGRVVLAWEQVEVIDAGKNVGR